MERARRGGGTFSLALFDLDGFKPINDERGHRAGDDCLVLFVRILERNLRTGDWISRWGGDEFVVGMWSTQEEDGRWSESAAERIAEDLRLNPLVLPDGEEVPLTVSVGNSRWRPGDNPGVLMARLDEALYRAKTSGGDTVVCLG